MSTLLIHLHTVKRLQLLLCITKKSIEHQLFVYTQLNYQTIQSNLSHLFLHSVNPNSSIWPIDRTIPGATTPGQSGSGNNGNEEVLFIPQISKAEASSSDGLMSYSYTHGGGILPHYRDVVSVFYSPSWLG